MEVVSLPAATAASLHPQIFRGLLPAVVNDVEVNLDAFNQAAEARLLNSLDMYKYVAAAIVRGNEAKTSRLVEPLHGPARHVSSPNFETRTDRKVNSAPRQGATEKGVARAR
jgi:hypothetical protein